MLAIVQQYAYKSVGLKCMMGAYHLLWTRVANAYMCCSTVWLYDIVCALSIIYMYANSNTYTCSKIRCQ